MNEPQKHVLRHMTRGQRIAFQAAVETTDRRCAQRIWGHAWETCRALCGEAPATVEDRRTA